MICVVAVRKKFVLPLLLVAAAGAILAIEFGSEVGGVADGEIVEPLQFIVTDSATGRPIVNARVRLRDLRHMGVEVPQERTELGCGIEGATDSGGVVTLKYKYPITLRWRGTAEDTTVVIPDYLWLEVTASEYKTELSVLGSVIGKTHRTCEWPLPPIHVSMNGQRRSSLGPRNGHE